MKEPNQPKERSFAGKVWTAIGIAALAVSVLWLLKTTFSILLLILAGALIAIFFRGLGNLLRNKLEWPRGVSLAVSVCGVLILMLFMFWLIGAKVSQQAKELSQTLPSTIIHVKNKMSSSAAGRQVLQQISNSRSSKKNQTLVRNIFSSTFGVLGDIYVILFLGIFFTIGAEGYQQGMLKLIPPKGRGKGEDVVSRIAHDLKQWLKGKLFAMFVVFVLTAIGLLILGVPMWLILSLIAGLLNFIPNFGPLIAMVPAVLVTLTKDPLTALLVACLYIVIQVVESNFITPKVQQKLVHLPPALIIIAQIIIAPLTNIWGVILATPVMVVAMAVIQELYIKNQTETTK